MRTRTVLFAVSCLMGKKALYMVLMGRKYLSENWPLLSLHRIAIHLLENQKSFLFRPAKVMLSIKVWPSKQILESKILLWSKMRGFSSSASLQRQTSSWAWPPCRITSPTEVPRREPGIYRHCASAWSTAVLGTYVSKRLFLATREFFFWMTRIWFRCRGRRYQVGILAQSENSDVGQSSTLQTVQSNLGKCSEAY